MSGTMSRRRDFPIQHKWHPGCSVTHGIRSVPWDIAEEAYAGYAKEYPSSARRQSIQRMAQRGGFSEYEMDLYAPGWRERLPP